MQPGWDITDKWLVCDACHHVLPHADELDKTNTPCPICGERGIRPMFPGYPEAELIHMAAYFFDRGEKLKIANQAQQLGEALVSLGREFDSTYLKDIAAELERQYDEAQDKLSDEAYRPSLDYLMREFHISLEQAMCVWHPLMRSTTETYKEHKATVLMACSAYESMLISLLIHVGIWCGGMDPTVAEDTVENIRSTKQMLDKFRRWSGCSYDDAVTQIGFVQFKEEWDEIKNLRNTFMHGKGDFLTRTAAATTVRLLPQLVAFFAALNNHFVPKTP